MTLILNTLDLSEYIMQKTNISETPVYVDGVNVGEGKTGYAIRDRVHTRYPAQFAFIPLPQSVLRLIQDECEKNEVEATYTSSRSNADITVTAQCSLSGYSFAMILNGERYYAGAVITIEEN